jgi:capsular polysaccharide export protein
MVFDEKGINYNNSLPRDEKFYKNYSSSVDLPTSLVPRVGKGRQIFTGEKEALPQNYIFVPFQVDYDTQIITHSHWIKNMRMLFDVIKSVAKDSEYHFIFKEHPSSGIEYSDLHKKAASIPNMSFRNTYSTQELIEKSQAVITINSTVGIESLLFHKKVIVLADAFYNIKNITYQARDKKALLEQINNIKMLELDTKIVDNFLKYLYHDYLIQKDENIYQILCKKILKD